MYDNEGQPITWVSPKNIVRIDYAIDIVKGTISAQREGQNTTNQNIENSNIYLYLNGEYWDRGNSKKINLLT